MKSNLAHLWLSSLEDLSPTRLWHGKVGSGDAFLFWGKAARPWAREVLAGASTTCPGPVLIISPESGEHPLPGEGSFRSGAALVDFFDLLRREQVRNLRVFLSGGASSLAWLPPANLSKRNLMTQLEALYRERLSIAELNQARSRLCCLKGGGAARLLARLAPAVRTEVEAISDVRPFGPEVIGSGPFFDPRHRIPHRVLCDNVTLLEKIAKRARQNGIAPRILKDVLSAPVEAVASALEKEAQRTLRSGRHGILIAGGEPTLKLPLRKGPTRGGRQTHLAALLTLKLGAEVRTGALEVLCGATDGVDGVSGSAGAYLTRGQVLSEMALSAAVRRFDTASAFRRVGALLPSFDSSTNVQDVVLIRF